MNKKFNLETEIKNHLDAGRKAIDVMGELIPMAYIYTKKNDLVIIPFNTSNRAKIKQDIREKVHAFEAYMVIITAESWVSNDTTTLPSLSKDRRESIHIYGETRDQNIMCFQEFKIDKNRKVVFGELSIQNNPDFAGVVSGFFIP